MTAFAVSCKDRCLEDPVCHAQGLCTTKGEACVATSDEHCALSAECKTHGRCAAGDGGRCIVRDDEGCRKADVCSEKGQCVTRGFACGVGDEQDCLRSRICLREGRCHMLPGYRDSPGCLIETGRAPAIIDPLELTELMEWSYYDLACEPHCGVVSDLDCERAQACISEMRCKARTDWRKTRVTRCVPGRAPSVEVAR